MRIFSAVTIITLLAIICSSSCGPSNSTTDQQNESAISDAMIGQLIMMGFRGKTMDDISPAIRQQIENGTAGSIILFDYDVTTRTADRNIESPKQVEALIAGMQALAPAPLLVAVDQEGGRVNRLKPAYGFPSLPSAQYLGEIDNLDSTSFYAGVNADNLQALGFNVNFAPVVDVNTNPENPVIGGIERSFSANPLEVAEHAAAWIAAHEQRNIVSVLKHFPGHGSSADDSHEGFTDVSDSWDELELEPYRQLVAQEGLLAVMTAHVFNKQIDSIYPATLSPNYITGLLREGMNYQGVVFSDDLQMKAVHALFDFETIVQKSLEAGVDILVFGNNLEYEENLAVRAHAAIRSLLEQGKISPERIRLSYDRVQALKAQINKN